MTTHSVKGNNNDMPTGTEAQAEKMKDTDEERSFYRDHTALYGLQDMKTAFYGYDKKEVRKYLQKILDDQNEQEKSMNKLVDELKMQIASLKRDKDESIQKYNNLLIAKLGGSDDGETLRHESEELQKKVLQLSGEVSTLTNEKNENTKRIADLEAENKALTEKNTQLGSASLANTTIADAKKLFAKQFSDINNEKKALEEQKQKVEQDLAECEENRTQLKDQLETLQPLFDEAKQELKEKTDELSTVKKERDETVTALQNEVNSLTDQNKKFQGISDYADSLKAALDKSNETEAVLRKEKKALEGKTRTLGLKNMALANENKLLTISLTQAQGALQDSKDYAGKLEDELTAAYDEDLHDGDDTNDTEEKTEEELPADGAAGESAMEGRSAS